MDKNIQELSMEAYSQIERTKEKYSYKDICNDFYIGNQKVRIFQQQILL